MRQFVYAEHFPEGRLQMPATQDFRKHPDERTRPVRVDEYVDPSVALPPLRMACAKPVFDLYRRQAGWGSTVSVQGSQRH